ncbi:hypothetical protein lerEdw1_015570 [Lerista edwardsae]|nr:hypothetical protein lerEdw1_015570 [Lerista edwardsae]
MKVTIFLLLTVLIPAQLTHADSCNLDDLIDMKLERKISSAVISAVKKVRLHCTSAFAFGAFANCPKGYQVTGCSCGLGCGSWEIRSDGTCHCKCVGVDGTYARCCKIGS